MNTQLMTMPRAISGRRPQRGSRRVHTSIQSAAFAIRTATADDAPAIHALIDAHLAEGRLLPRSLAELTIHASRFVVAVEQSGRRAQARVIGCAELAPLSATVAEVRSLVVDRPVRALGIGKRLIAELRRAASLGGFEQLCAFTHDAGYFVRKGFSIIPHHWLPEKIARDCTSCVQFRTCGQHAVVLPLKG
jgi:amino-acid N-acetyltransferase